MTNQAAADLSTVVITVITTLRAEIEDLRHEFSREIEDLRHEFSREIEELRSEMHQLGVT